MKQPLQFHLRLARPIVRWHNGRNYHNKLIKTLNQTGVNAALRAHNACFYPRQVELKNKYACFGLNNLMCINQPPQLVLCLTCLTCLTCLLPYLFCAAVAPLAVIHTLVARDNALVHGKVNLKAVELASEGPALLVIDAVDAVGGVDLLERVKRARVESSRLGLESCKWDGSECVRGSRGARCNVLTKFPPRGLETREQVDGKKRESVRRQNSAKT